MRIKTSIIVPVFNEEEMIEKTIEALKVYLNEETELIAVNDASTDKTPELLSKIPGITVITHQTNRGYGAALKSGIRKSQGDYILIIDADGTYPTESIKELIMQADNFDMVVGARINAHHIPLLRKPAKWVLGKLASYLTGAKIPDLNSGLRIIKKDVLMKFIRILPDGFSFTTTITLALLTSGFQVKYLPIDYYKRKGRSKIRPIRDTLNFLQLILRTILYFNPVKIFIPLAMLLFFSSVGVFIFTYFFAPKISDITVAILLISAIQMLGIGMLADLITRSRNY